MEKDTVGIENPKATKTEGKEKFELRNKTGDYFKGAGEMGSYLLRIFGKKDPSKPKGFNLSVMHGINRISLIIFLLALIYMIARKVF